MSLDRVFHTIGKPSLKRGAQKINIEFEIFYELKKIENHFYIYFDNGNNTKHTKARRGS